MKSKDRPVGVDSKESEIIGVVEKKGPVGGFEGPGKERGRPKERPGANSKDPRGIGGVGGMARGEFELPGMLGAAEETPGGTPRTRKNSGRGAKPEPGGLGLRARCGRGQAPSALK